MPLQEKLILDKQKKVIKYGRRHTVIKELTPDSLVHSKLNIIANNFTVKEFTIC